MNSTLDVILVNRCNHSDGFQTVLPAKMCVRGLLILMLAAAAVLVVGAGASADIVFIPDNGTLIGVTYNSAESEQDMEDLRSFENWSGKKHSVVVVFQGFSPDGQSPFPRNQLDNLWQNGNTPILTLEPWGSADILDVMNNETLDPYFEEYAQDMKNWTQESWTVGNKTGTRKQLFLRFAHEMNLHGCETCYPWSNRTPESYKAAWRHVHDIFESKNLTSADVQWVWCVNNYDVPYDGYKAEEYYPGDDYVDWVGIDGYNTGESVPNASWDHWGNFTQLFEHMLDRFANHSSISKKPCGIFEIGSSSVVEANVSNGTFNIFTNTNSPTNHYAPSGWMGDWQDIQYEEVTNDSFQEISCGNSSIRVTCHTDPQVENHYIPSGWTGGYIEFSDGYVESVYSGSTSIMVNYSINQPWAGIYWQSPANNRGDMEGGYNLTGAEKLVFAARGESGGEAIKFSMGGAEGDYPDSASAWVEVILKDTWQEYTIDLTGKNLSHIITGFGWSATQSDNPDGCTFYLDDIKYRYEDKNFSIYTDKPAGWAGIYWQSPANNWGNKEGGYNLTCAEKLIFAAKGELGSERVSFMMGGVSGSNSSDTANASTEVNLTDVWKKYVIDLTGKNLSNIITGFGLVASKSDNPDGCTIYLDEIRYENVSVELAVPNNTKKGEWITETYNSIKNHSDIKMVCYFNVDKGGTKYLTGESDWAVFTTPQDNRNNIDDCTFDPNKRIAQYNESVRDEHYIYRFPLYLEDKVVYVDDDFTDDLENHRWDSIQEGINDAGDGYTIFVHNGTYYENVVVNKSLTLKGENRNNTIIDGVGSGEVIRVTANNCVINGFTVRNGGYCGMELYYSSNNTITGNTISSNGRGIYLTNHSSHNTIAKNMILHNRYSGISIFYININNTIIANNISNNGGDGIFLRDYNDNNVIMNNNIVSNNGDGIYLLWSCDYNNITGNTVLNNGMRGIYIKDLGDHNIIMNNNISSNMGDGILLHWGSDRNIITGNTVTNNQNGIVIRYSSDSNIVTNNTVSSNNDTGISLTWVYYWGSSDNNLIYHNNIVNNAKQAYDNGTNSWDNGSVDGGNYWNDHICTGNPSNGSQPYCMDKQGVDHHPFEDMDGWLPQKGDLNSDGYITPADAAIALHLAATGAHNDAADVSGDDSVTSLDALMILQAAAENMEL